MVIVPKMLNLSLLFLKDIVGVFKPTRWFLSEEYIGRWEFEGEEIEDSPYVLMNISHLLRKRQNPVMYIIM